ncbi:MAG: electron transport complex subunit RsxA [Gammaproteobacteria bacterium]|nr:electron transport complex subunit RsxA [Gammaproteobacteria bacterium]
MSDLLLIFISASLVNNLVLHHLIGVGAGVGLSRKIDVAAGMSLVTAVALTVATPVTWVVSHAVLRASGLAYLELLAFVLVIIVVVMSGAAVLARLRPDWHDRYRDFVPLVLGNSAVLGVVLLNAGQHFGFAGSLFYGLGAAAGFGLVVILVAALHERLLVADVPRPFQGAAALLMALGILSMAFMGFTGLTRL